MERSYIETLQQIQEEVAEIIKRVHNEEIDYIDIDVDDMDVTGVIRGSSSCGCYGDDLNQYYINIVDLDKGVNFVINKLQKEIDDKLLKTLELRKQTEIEKKQEKIRSEKVRYERYLELKEIYKDK